MDSCEAGVCVNVELSSGCGAEVSFGFWSVAKVPLWTFLAPGSTQKALMMSFSLDASSFHSEDFECFRSPSFV